MSKGPLKRTLSFNENYRKKKGPKRTKSNVVLSLSPLLPFPPVKYVKFRYSTLVQLSPVSGAIAVHSFTLNGLYDPDYTGTGGQPRYFDTLVGSNGTSAPYKKYQVVSATVSSTFVNGNGSGASINDVGHGFRKSTSTAPSSADEAAERNMYYTRIQSVDENSHSVTYMPKKHVKIRDILGTEMDVEHTSGEQGSNPVENIKYDVFTQPIDGVSSYTISCRVKIEFVARLFVLNDVLDS